MKPYYEHAGITIYHGDCREILPSLGKFDLLLTDPPYGINIGGSGTIGGSGVVLPKDYGKADWDVDPMSREQWQLIQPRAKHWIVWGGNHLAGVLGASAGVLVWDKKCQNGWDDSFSECEIAWTNIFTRAKAFRHLWAGALRASERGANVREHPTQKPIALMGWCISLAPGAKSVIDPFLGSGTTLVAAKAAGLTAVGIEREEKYCEIAAKRLSQEVLFQPQHLIPPHCPSSLPLNLSEEDIDTLEVPDLE